jgi:hypothetical protein
MADATLTNETNARFWRRTRHKPGQRLDMTDPRDRAMAKVWLDVFAEVRNYRDSATREARRLYNETLTPYLLVIQERDGSTRPFIYQHRGNLDVQYAWVVDQMPDRYTYLAAFDLTRQAEPIYDHFSRASTAAVGYVAWHG